MAIPTIILLRHGETDLNKPGMMRGWTDVPLDSTGLKQSKESAKVVAQEWPIAKIYSGDLKRQIQSAEFLAKETGLKVEKTEALRPWNGGELVGKYVPDLGTKLKYYIEHKDEKPKDGESMNTFLDRLLGFMAKVFDEATSTTPIAVVTSIRPIEATIGWIEAGLNDGIDDDKLEAKKETVGPSGIVELQSKRKKDDWTFKVFKANKPKEEGTS
jgi:broad specificity phosphatase PhoE